MDGSWTWLSTTGQSRPIGPARCGLPIGYWAFEDPGPGDPEPRADEVRWPTLRWSLTFLQPYHPDLQVDHERTKAALNWLLSEGPRFGVEKVFLEPHLVKRFNLSSPLLRFQGCRAARHDDHIHIQIAPDPS